MDMKKIMVVLGLLAVMGCGSGRKPNPHFYKAIGESMRRYSENQQRHLDRQNQHAIEFNRAQAEKDSGVMTYEEEYYRKKLYGY
jgi:hypothetical protein